MIQQRLRYLRQQRNLTQHQIASQLNVVVQQYQTYERGIRKPSYEVLLALADCFDVSVDYLMGRTNNPRINPAQEE